jgi:hypothetical protein
MLKAAGFAEVRTVVTHFHWGDIPYGAALEKRNVPAPAFLGRTVGWYVTGIGRKP